MELLIEMLSCSLEIMQCLWRQQFSSQNLTHEVQLFNFQNDCSFSPCHAHLARASVRLAPDACAQFLSEYDCVLGHRCSFYVITIVITYKFCCISDSYSIFYHLQLILCKIQSLFPIQHVVHSSKKYLIVCLLCTKDWAEYRDAEMTVVWSLFSWVIDQNISSWCPFFIQPCLLLSCYQ